MMVYIINQLRFVDNTFIKIGRLLFHLPRLFLPLPSSHAIAESQRWHNLRRQNWWNLNSESHLRTSRHEISPQHREITFCFPFLRDRPSHICVATTEAWSAVIFYLCHRVPSNFQMFDHVAIWSWTQIGRLTRVSEVSQILVFLPTCHILLQQWMQHSLVR